MAAGCALCQVENWLLVVQLCQIEPTRLPAARQRQAEQVARQLPVVRQYQVEPTQLLVVRCVRLNRRRTACWLRDCSRLNLMVVVVVLLSM